jgi:uncharacterized protein
MPLVKSAHRTGRQPSPAVVTAREARLLLLGAQGLLADPARLATASSLQRLIKQMGFVQIDTINVVERAHHLTLFSRLQGYDPSLLARLLEKRRTLFEHWTHDASIIPLEWFGQWRYRFDRYKSRVRRNAWWRERLGKNPDALLDEIRSRIERDGPTLSRDFERDRDLPKEASDGWWGWKPQKAALEHLWRAGELAVVRRENFQKVYDLTHRVFPDHHALPPPSEDEHVDWACSSALERLGVGTPAELAGFWNAVDFGQARRWCEARSREGGIEPVLVGPMDGSTVPSPAGPRVSYALRDWRRRVKRLPDPPETMRLLSPFDPVVRDRHRLRRLFGFEYTFEAFTPAPRRVHGYYVLPVLQGDQLVGRIDPKLHRERGVLEVKGVWWEPGVRPTRARRAALEGAVGQLAAFVGARTIAW